MSEYRCIKLECIADIRTPLVRGVNVTRTALVEKGRCRENTQKMCNKCKDFDAFGNKKCHLNGR